ncbi:MAG: cytochrome P450 [Gammaproteobacteria bacterium]|nr:cytochrome P450 [Gammaproteobacteria bacterium]
MNPPTHDIDPTQFWHNPYPTLKELRIESPIAYVPQLDAVLFCKRNDIALCEKNIDVFSSRQPGGLMTVLMGENMMRKDGEAHSAERKQAFLSLSPGAVKKVWLEKFNSETDTLLDALAERDTCDLVTDFAMPVSAHALRHITGLLNMTTEQMDQCSQRMIDGIANYVGDAEVESNCHQATQLIDRCIGEIADDDSGGNSASLIHVLTRSGQPFDSVRANIKLAISGGQNEPRDAIAGAAWALLTHPDQLSGVINGDYTWRQAFEEYARWISPIGMSPRRVAQPFKWNGVSLQPDSRVFFMFSSANRDESVFENPDQFLVGRDTSKSISFGAGPHFCAGAFASRALIADVALPKLFERFPKLSLNGEVAFGGWAFRGPLSVPVRLK